MSGPPFLEVVEWQKGKDSLAFWFCFPIIQSDILPQHPEINFRNFYRKKALKATYNGNYISSDRAWYVLIDYAKQNDMEIYELPFEIFYNHPNMQGNPLDWKAEVFMPLKAPADE